VTSAIAAVGTCSPIVPATMMHAVTVRSERGWWESGTGLSVAVREQQALAVLRNTFGPEREEVVWVGLADIACPSCHCSLS
jgi:hypothetical protein